MFNFFHVALWLPDALVICPLFPYLQGFSASPEVPLLVAFFLSQSCLNIA